MWWLTDARPSHATRTAVSTARGAFPTLGETKASKKAGKGPKDAAAATTTGLVAAADGNGCGGSGIAAWRREALKHSKDAVAAELEAAAAPPALSPAEVDEQSSADVFSHVGS